MPPIVHNHPIHVLVKWFTWIMHAEATAALSIPQISFKGAYRAVHRLLFVPVTSMKVSFLSGYEALFQKPSEISLRK